MVKSHSLAKKWQIADEKKVARKYKKQAKPPTLKLETANDFENEYSK